MADAIARFGPDSSAPEVAAALRSDGVAIVERLAPEELCDRVAAELDPILMATEAGGDDFVGDLTKRPGALLASCPSSVEMVAHDLVLQVADEVLWPQKSSFQLHLTQAIAIGPGESAQQLHRDQWAFDFFQFPSDVEVEVSTIWALTDFTEANGATRVALGAHALADADVAAIDPADTVAAEMPRGSVVLYTGRAVHGGGANTSDRTRIGINVDYVLGWLRQEENQYLSVPREVAAALPEKVQRLMGYQMGAYALGYVGNLRDPISVLREAADADTERPTFAP
ncbi:MAG: phytanoyl-CoA dioxygenase family protein [Actinomycetia bacterium]|nr:phytanoyl-CoA dioxygenase family protein [Actinomycetes bacterium]